MTVYIEDDMANLPVGSLGEAVEIAAPLDESALIDAFVEGEWRWTENFPAIVCGNDSGRVRRDAYGEGEIFRIERSAGGIRFIRPAISFEREYPQTGPGVYADSSVQEIQTGSTTYSTTIEWTSASSGVWTSITEYALSYCGETFTHQVNFERVE